MSTATSTPPRTSRADVNFLSGTPEGWTLFAGTEHATPTSAPEHDAFILPPEPQQYDAILKTSRVEMLRLFEIQVAQGRENSLDANAECMGCSFEGDFGVGGEQAVCDQIITTKGGCRWMTYAGTIHSRGRNADVTVGAWSDQSHERSAHLDYSGLRHADGKPIRFILARCDDVKLPLGAKVLRLKSLLFSCYWYLKFAAVKLGLFK